MFASTTKYSLKGVPTFMMFAIMSLRSIHQANNSRGLIAMKIRLRDFRTLTVWKSEADMKAFRNSRAHLKAMLKSIELGSNQSYSWQTERIPTWKEAITQLDRKNASEQLD